MYLPSIISFPERHTIVTQLKATWKLARCHSKVVHQPTHGSDQATLLARSRGFAISGLERGFEVVKTPGHVLHCYTSLTVFRGVPMQG